MLCYKVDVNDLDNSTLATYKNYYDKEGRLYQLDSPQGFVRYSFSDITGRKLSTFMSTAWDDDDETYYDKVEYAYDQLGRLATVMATLTTSHRIMPPLLCSTPEKCMIALLPSITSEPDGI